MEYTIVGAGRIGTTLASIMSNGTVVRRGERIPAGTGPIIVCTRNDDLKAVVNHTPHHRRADLVFVQNGMLQSWLQSEELEDCTQALLYFAVSKVGEVPIDGGGSVVRGKWASEFTSLLARGDISCTVVNDQQYMAQVAEKFLWNCVFGVLCQYFDCSVGILCQQYEQETRLLIEELQGITARELGIVVDPAVSNRLLEYSMSIPHYQGAVKEWSWRNGWLWKRQKSPLHRQYLGALVTVD